MFSALKDHPFVVEAFFNTSIVLTFAFPKEQLEPLVPECLELDTLNNQWAFLAVAIVDTKGLRPKGFPGFMGNSFILTGYRLFVKYRNNAGKRLRGLYILKSETDKKLMEIMGNVFTHYKYQRTGIHLQKITDEVIVTNNEQDFLVRIRAGDDAALPAGSPFVDWKEARRFAGPLPFTFSYDTTKREVLIVEGVRENWVPQPVEVIEHQIHFIKELGLVNGQLANAFVISNIPYYWKKGRKEIWKP